MRPISGFVPFSPRSAPLVITSPSLAAAEAMHFRRLSTAIGFRVRVAFRRLALGTPLTSLDVRLISQGTDLLSLLRDLSPPDSGSGGAGSPSTAAGQTRSISS